MRCAVTKHIFHEPRKEFVACTGPWKVFAKMSLMSVWVEMVCEEMWPSAVEVTFAEWSLSEMSLAIVIEIDIDDRRHLGMACVRGPKPRRKHQARAMPKP